MAEIIASDITAIMDVDVTIADLSPFITAAAQITDEWCGTLTDAQLKEVQRWLAAHLVAIRDMRPASEKAGSVSVNYQYKLGMNFACTMYGQQAMMLDVSGGLARANKSFADGKGGKPQMDWAGWEDYNAE
jgi:hypothetical protein